MKKILALILALCMVFALSAVAFAAEDEISVAMITDYGDITDQSFNQTTYEACKEYCEENGIDFKYYKPASDSDADRVAMIENAIDEGFNVIVMPGFAFAPAIAAYYDTEISGDAVTTTAVYFPRRQEDENETFTVAVTQPTAGENYFYDGDFDPTTVTAATFPAKEYTRETYPWPTVSTTAPDAAAFSPAD